MLWIKRAVEKAVDTSMNTELKTTVRIWIHLFFVDREFLKQMKWRSGGITIEMAVNTNPPSCIKDFNHVNERISNEMMSPKKGQK